MRNRSLRAAPRPQSRQGSGTEDSLNVHTAKRFADLVLACIQKQYPNKISHSLSSDDDVAAPRNLTPAFYGCFDWHSSVHGHWSLVRLIRRFPTAAFAEPSLNALSRSLTRENIAQEVAYLRAEGRAAFERPYGLAWLLQLFAEMWEWDDPHAREFAQNLHPLTQAALARLRDWLPKLSHPVRSGEHAQTAFALGLMLDYARSTGDAKFGALVESRAQDFYFRDQNGPLAYEPSGEDFLSPCLGEADLMRRLLPRVEFARWLRTFLPQISASTGGLPWLQPVVSPDPSDPKFSHLDGLNLSRAWMLEGVASGLPRGDKRVPLMNAAAEQHRRAGLAAVTGKHYEGGHWLGSFAVYLITQRGIDSQINRS